MRWSVGQLTAGALVSLVPAALTSAPKARHGAYTNVVANALSKVQLRLRTMNGTTLLVLLFIAAISYNCARQVDDKLIYQRLKPCRDGEYDSTVLCGQFAVFENTQTRVGRKINLNVVVIPAIHERNKAPIFFFEGGPGIAVTNGGSFYADSINYYRIEHDIVLVDVRGTGNSNPLHCWQLQYKENLTERLGVMYPEESVKECYDSLSKLADLTQYTTTNMAIDIEETRKWLGYNKISLFGLSFGTRLAQVYMKMFPRSVESCVLQSPTTTYSKLPLYHAQFAEESLENLFDDCEKDSLCNTSFPQIKKEFASLMTKGKKKPFEYKFEQSDGKIQRVTIPWYSFETKIRGLMYSPSGLKRVPFIIHQSYLENWRPFLSLFPTKSSFNDFSAEGLYLCVTCTEDVPFISSKEVDSLTKGTFMGDYRVKQQIAACNNWTKGTVPDDYFTPLQSTIPTLVFSGYFDPVTPPSMAKQIVKTLPNSFLITIPTMSHVYEGLSNPECFDKIVVDFFNKPNVYPDAECIKKMTPHEYMTKE